MRIETNLNRLWTREGMSQDALAEKLGVSRQSVSRRGTDSSVPELDKLARLDGGGMAGIVFPLCFRHLADLGAACPAVSRLLWPNAGTNALRLV